MDVTEALTLENVGKKFLFFREKQKSIKDWAKELLGRSEPPEEIWALRDVSLTVERGEMVGVIGRNGSGKSTLLHLAAGLLRPTVGRVDIRGSVSPLLELGSSFSIELSGRENVHLYGALLGHNAAEINRAIPRIVEFSGIGDFLDVAVKRYSSGMFLRLAFSAATQFRKDVLLVDEALSVGDENFQKMCFQEIERIKADGTAALFVTHDMNIMKKICDRAVWLEEGRVAFAGVPEETAARYFSFLESASNEVRALASK